MKLAPALGVVFVALALGVGAIEMFASAETAKIPEPPKAAPARKVEAAQQPVGGDPQSTQASYGDWVLRCQRNGASEDGQLFCEVAQTIQIERQPAPFAQIAFGRLKKGEALQLTVALPANVAFPSAPKLLLDGKDQDAIELSWRKCLPGGCFAGVALTEDNLRKLRAAQGAGSIVSKDSVGQEFKLPMSFRGLAQALDALARTP